MKTSTQITILMAVVGVVTGTLFLGYSIGYRAGFNEASGAVGAAAQDALRQAETDLLGKYIEINWEIDRLEREVQWLAEAQRAKDGAITLQGGSVTTSCAVAHPPGEICPND